MSAPTPLDEPLDCGTFVAHLLAHIDEELAPPFDSAARRHEAACGPCAERAGFERALEARLGAALAGDADARAVTVALAHGRPSSDEAPDRQEPRTGRILRPVAWARGVAAAAAVAFVLVQGAWFFCIPPFECSVLQAVENVVDEPTVAVPTAERPRSEVLAALSPPSRFADWALEEGPLVAPLRLRDSPEALRARYRCGEEHVTAVWSDPNGHEPSFRRRVESEGQAWWIADEDGHVVVAWMCPKTNTLCSLIGSLPRARMLEMAKLLRAGAH